MGNVIELRLRKIQDDIEQTISEMADVNSVIKDNEMVWHCLHCGHPLFFVTKERGILCQACGQVQTWDNDK